jgi:AcrR family transcriptional regulator
MLRDEQVMERPAQSARNIPGSEILKTGFRALKIDDIAARAGAGKMTIYRHWPNKAAVVMDAFLTIIGPGDCIPEASRAVVSIKLQMRLQGKFFRGKYGRLIKSLLAEAFRERWILPRRVMSCRVLQETVHQGDLRPILI